MRRLISLWVGLSLSSGLSLAEGTVSLNQTIKEALPALVGGKESPLTGKIFTLAKEWAAKKTEAKTSISKEDAENPIALKLFTVPDNTSYVGAEANMKINAPIARVNEVITNFAEYDKIFPGYKNVQVIDHKGNQWVIAWEQIIPVFFLSNLHYDLIYRVDHLANQREIYRIQLKSGSLNSFDGMIRLAPDGKAGTRFLQLTFWDADYGMLKTLAPGKIWSGGAETVYLAALAFKYRAENPDWKSGRVRSEARKMLERFPVDDVVGAKKPSP